MDEIYISASYGYISKRDLFCAQKLGKVYSRKRKMKGKN